MSDSQTPYEPKSGSSIRANEIENREWWLWGFAVTVTLALAAGIIALTFPGFQFGTETWFWSDLKERVRGLAALVLLFDVYTAYQHLQLQRLRKQLAERTELFELISENAADMIAVVDTQGKRLYNSPAYQRVLGYSPAELYAQSSADKIHPSDQARVLQASEKARLTGRGQRLEYRMRHKDGSWRVLESTASTICGLNGKIEKFVIVNRDITERKRAEELLAHNAFHDPLTNLPNRALFLDRLQQAVARARRHSDYRFAVLFIDVDDFKLFNDSLGHFAGDQLLVQIGKRLATGFRQSDTVARSPDESRARAEDNDSVARLGGDEFTVLLEDIANAGDAVRVAQRIQDRWAAPFIIDEQEVVISSSIGIALSSVACVEAENLVRDAELAMYRAKRAGRAHCEVFDPAMHATAVRRLNLERELRRAIERGELKVYYQPIVSLESERIVGFEALSRWQRPEELVMPSEFIPVANETGLIVPINRLLLLDACEQLRSWQSRFPADPPLMMSVNIAPKQFAQPDLAADICLAIDQTGVSPKTLQLEIVETLAMSDAEKAAQVLAELKALGVRLSIDDFGTGYSSLSRLRRLPVDSLKVDRTFISTMDEDSDSREIVRLIITMARTLRLKVVAEGAETEMQINHLKQLNCEMAQGYFFSRPIPADAVTELLQHKSSRASLSQANI